MAGGAVDLAGGEFSADTIETLYAAAADNPTMSESTCVTSMGGVSDHGHAQGPWSKRDGYDVLLV